MCYNGFGRLDMAHVDWGPAEDKWLELLIDKREAQFPTDQAFADFIGIDRSLWSRIRSKERVVSIETKILVSKLYPDLHLVFLGEVMTLGEDKGARLTDKHGDSADLPPNAPEGRQKAVLRRQDT